MSIIFLVIKISIDLVIINIIKIRTAMEVSSELSAYLYPRNHQNPRQDSYGKSEGVPEVDALIKSKALLVISKTFCPHCKRTKQVSRENSY